MLTEVKEKQAIVLDGLPAPQEITVVVQDQFSFFDESSNSAL